MAQILLPWRAERADHAVDRPSVPSPARRGRRGRDPRLPARLDRLGAAAVHGLPARPEPDRRTERPRPLDRLPGGRAVRRQARRHDGQPVERVADLVEATWANHVGTPVRYTFLT